VSLSSVFGALAVVASVAFVWPQVVRLLRTHDTDGVSPVSALWAGAAYALWTAYGLRNDLPSVWIANGQLTVGFAVITVLVARYGTPDRRLVPAAVVVVATVAAISLLTPEAVPGLVAVVVGSSAFLPQAHLALTQDDLSGVSVPTYLLIASSTVFWFGFGVLEADPIVIVPSLLIGPVALLIALRAHRSHDRLNDGVTPGTPR
jgi:uncharacterized protein with PQ loop repeat